MTAQYLDKEKVLKAMSECDGNRLDMIETGMAKDIGDLTLLLSKMDAGILKMQDQIKGLEHRLRLAQDRIAEIHPGGCVPHVDDNAGTALGEDEP